MEGPIILDRACLDRIPARRRDANKGTYQKVLVIAGSAGMCGAAYLAALSAYRTGAGLVHILTVEENRQILQILIPEAIIHVFRPEEAAGAGRAWTERLGELLGGMGVVILGPGIGTERYARALTGQVMGLASCPLVVDADGLNAVAADESLCGFFGPHVILTPHPGEMSRLTGQSVKEILGDTLRAASEYRDRHGVTCVLKTHETVTAGADGRLFVNRSGSPAMAKAGSGDVLTGVIAGLLCLGFSNTDAAALGVYIHGLAGEAAAGRIGEHGTLARDIADAVASVMKKAEKNDSGEDML